VSATFLGLAIDAKNTFDGTQIERSAVEAKSRFDAYQGVAIASVCASAIALGVGAALAIRAARR